MKSFTLKSDQLIFIIIIMQPIIDLLTSLSTMYNIYFLSIGALVRTALMIVLAIYIFFYLFHKRSRIIYLYLASFLAILTMFLVNIRLKTPFILIEEMSFALKTAYFIVMLFTVAVLLDKHISKANLFRASNMVAIIIGISYWIAIFTNTGKNSYRYGESGFSGWFYATNELSVTVIILLGLAIAHLYVEKSMRTWLAFLLITSMLPMIGTKVAFLGGIIILLFYGILLLFQHPKHLFRQTSNIFYFAIVIVFFLAIPFSPAATNTKNVDYMGKQQTEVRMIATEKPTINHPILSKLLSSRDIYFQEKKDDFFRADGVRKAFGLGYAGDYSDVPKVIEMDFFDLFFSYGFIGAILLVLPLFYVARRILVFPFNVQKLLLLLTAGLCFGFSFLAGHVLFAPFVMSYVAILFLVIGLPSTEKGWRWE